MASVAICPHCYLQLVVPDGVESDERVECPACAKEFSLDQAVLRAIPEVVRRPRSVERTEEAAEVEAVVAEVVEAEVVEIIAETDNRREAAVIDEIKTQIEAEIATNGLHPGTESMLPLELPSADAESDESPAVGQVDEDVAAWFGHAETVSELPPAEELLQQLDLVAVGDLDAGDLDAMTQAAGEAAEIDVAACEEIVERVDDVTSEPVESQFTLPASTTLADLMPPREVREEFEEPPGPSFELPNVPLTSTIGATVEIDPSMSFGPAAETEFELDDVNFDATPVEESVANEPAEFIEPVFSEPEAAAIPAVPFVLTGISRAKKKRSVARTLVGTALGGVVGLSLGYFVLLYALGPEGDLLHVAEYIPSAMLPKSFDRAPVQIAEAEPEPTEDAATKPTVDEESAAVPASYAEESKSPVEPASLDEPANDDRYGAEPSPLDEPAAKPILDDTQSTTTPPLPLHGPTFTVEQLATAFKAGKAAYAGLVTGDLSDPAVRRTKGMSYARLCDLAEALTFVDRSSPSVESEETIAASDRLFRKTLADSHTRNEVARIAQIWIDSPHRGHGGILLAGSVSGGQIAGDLYEYELATEDGGKLTLLIEQPLDPSVESANDPIGIVGSIVENPADQVAGYNGTARRAIWVTRAIPLD